MDFNTIKKIIITLTFLFFIPCKSYIYNIDFFQDNSLFCLGDTHFGMNSEALHPTLSNKDLFHIHKKQANDIINFINKNYKPEDCLLLIEDFFDTKDEKYKQKFISHREMNLKHNNSCIFDFLNELCIKNNIPFINLEFRQISILFFYFSQVTAEEFLQHFAKINEEIKNYNDTQDLNNYYKDMLNIISNKHGSFINLLNRNKNKFINEITKNVKMKEDFLADYRKLLDLRIVHEIYQNKNTKHIFLCAGSNHTLRVKEILNKIGYKQTSKKEYSQFQPLNLKAILNKSINENIQHTRNNIIQQDNVQTYNINVLILIILADLLIKLGYVFFRKRQMQKTKI